ncbi:MAG: hypothetical protein IJI44_06625 [Erysipelotrichaceae bacterium]|nr:hypothetical protein [Erysipelotrichaceae bacterium]
MKQIKEVEEMTKVDLIKVIETIGEQIKELTSDFDPAGKLILAQTVISGVLAFAYALSRSKGGE